MGFTIKIEALNGVSGEVIVPDPFTGAHWLTYRAALAENETIDERWLRTYRAALTVIEGGYVTVEGKRYDLKTTGMDIPLESVWVLGPEVDAYVAGKFNIPKPLSSALSQPQTESETSPKNS